MFQSEILPIKSIDIPRKYVNLQMYVSLSIFSFFKNSEFINQAYRRAKVLSGLIILSALKKWKETMLQIINIQVI